jgi:hypothetical protein
MVSGSIWSSGCLCRWKGVVLGVSRVVMGIWDDGGQAPCGQNDV